MAKISAILVALLATSAFGHRVSSGHSSKHRTASPSITTTVRWKHITTTPGHQSTQTPTGGAGSDTYTLYTGNGSVAAGWPSQDRWVSFDDMVSANKPEMGQCSGGIPSNSAEETDDIISAIQDVSKTTGVDSRFILAIVMQESGGCVRVNTTNYGVNNPGLMQDHDGSAMCNDNKQLTNPCPAATIKQMITDGTAGTPQGDGLEQTIKESGTGTVSDYYRGARIYNSGSIASNGKLECGIATHCYSSDVANRLTGWVKAQTKCTWTSATAPGC